MFAEDLAPFFDTDAGFAQTATVGAASFPVIFDSAYQAPLGGMIESTGPVCQAKSADVSTVVQGTAITVNAVAYKVREVQPDGTGVTTLFLERAA
ncbi:MAG: hypothetical protein RL375_753 [Pseudomonadota bacterium]|jgi:hypothetical protein